MRPDHSIVKRMFSLNVLQDCRDYSDGIDGSKYSDRSDGRNSSDEERSTGPGPVSVRSFQVRFSAFFSGAA